MKRYTALALTLTLTLATSNLLAQAAAEESAKAQPDDKAKPTVNADDARKAEGMFEAGRKLFFQAKYKDAAAILADAVKTDPTKGSYKLLLSKAYRYAGESDRAVGLLADILKENPEHVEAGVTLAELLSPKKQPDKVIQTLEPLLKFKRDYPLYHLLAEAHNEKGDLDKARKYYEEAVRLNPRAGGDLYELGNIYLAQSRFARSANAYERANALGVDTDVFHFKLASVYFNLRNYLGRIGTAKVVGGKPGQIKNQMLLIDPVPGQADTFYVTGPKSAVYQVVLAQKMGVKLPGIRFLEGNIWLSARRHAKADAIYKSLEGKLEKGDQGLFWYYWAQTALGLGQFETYLERLNKAIEAEPDVYKPTLAEAYLTVAQRYQQAGESDKHIAYLHRAVQTNPLSASLHLTLGDAHWQAGHRDKAIEQYKLVLELEPNHGQRVRLLNRIRGEEDTPKVGPTKTVQR